MAADGENAKRERGEQFFTSTTLAPNTLSEKAVLADDLGGGPKGLGDPNCTKLRRVEREILIPKKMKTKAHQTHCKDIVKALTDCGKTNGLLMPFKCRKENRALEECLTKWYYDENFKAECTQEYLNQRSEYRRTGIKQNQKKKDLTGF